MKNKKRLSGMWMVLGVGVMAAAIAVFALLPRDTDAAYTSPDAGATVLDLSAAGGDDILSQSDRFSVSGNGVVVSGTDPVKIKGDGTGEQWSVLIKDAKNIAVEDDTKISNTFFAVNMPEGATFNALGRGISIDGRILASSSYNKRGILRDTKGVKRTTKNGVLTFTDSKGKPVSGWIASGGYWYYCKADGTPTSGWVFWKNNWYYCNPDGKMATGWVGWNGKWYFLNSPNGEMATGWVYYNGSWYWLKADGSMAANEQIKTSSKTYRFAANGVCANPY